MAGKRWIWPGLGVLLLLIFLLLSPIKPITSLGMKVVGIFLFTIVWWATVGRGFTSIMAIVLFAVFGVMKPTELFAASWGNRLVLMLIDAFGLSGALRFTGFSRRFALWFICRRFVSGHPWRLVAMFLLSCTLLGSFTSSTNACLVSLAVAEPMLEALGYKKGDRFAAMLIMGIAWASTSSSAITPIAHSTILTVLDWLQRDFGYGVSFLQWVAFGIPTGLLSYLMLLGFYRYVVRPDVTKISKSETFEYVRGQCELLAPISLEEKIAVGVFLAVVIIWVSPTLISGILPSVSVYLDRLGTAIPPLAGASLLCAIRVKDHPVLSFAKWMTEGVEWNAIALVATVQVLAIAIQNPDTGITEFLIGLCGPLGRSLPLWGFLGCSVFLVVLQTNVASKMVPLTLVYTVMVPIAVACGTGNPVALGATIAVASNYGFALPSAVASTAIVVGSGWVPVPFMARYGFLLVIPVTLLLAFVCYPLASVVLR
ncbi:MAG: SLC13 family permease [Chloroflexota bacterium]